MPVMIAMRTGHTHALPPLAWYSLVTSWWRLGHHGAATLDDIAILWLTDGSKTSAVVSALDANASSAGIASNLSGAALASQFNDPATDPRAPNVVTAVVPGVIYAGATATKRSEHGGFGHDDTNVPILLSVLADEATDGPGQQVLMAVTTMWT